MSLTEWVQDLCADLTDVTLADEDTNSILSDNANRAFQSMGYTQVGCHAFSISTTINISGLLF